MNTITKLFIESLSTKKPKTKTATVYFDGKPYVQYSLNIAFEVTKEIGGLVVSYETGEILNKRKYYYVK